MAAPGQEVSINKREHVRVGMHSDGKSFGKHASIANGSRSSLTMLDCSASAIGNPLEYTRFAKIPSRKVFSLLFLLYTRGLVPSALPCTGASRSCASSVRVSHVRGRRKKENARIMLDRGILRERKCDHRVRNF